MSESGSREEFESPLPCDIQAEQAVLGAMMLSADALAECLELVTRDAFLRPAHQIVFEAISALATAGQAVDWLTVKDELERRGDTGRTGGPFGTHTLMRSVPSAANGAFYARRLLELQTQRELEIAGVRIRQIATEPGPNRSERIERAYEALDQATGNAVRTGAVPVSDLVIPLMESLEHPEDAEPGMSTGTADLDQMLGGLRDGQLIVVAGRPGMGKSVALLGMAANAALRQGRTVLAVTLEMSRDEYMERLMAAEARVELTRIRDRALDQRDWDRVAKAYQDFIAAQALLIHDGPQMTVQDLRAEIRALRRAGRMPDLVTVDYLQLMTGPARHRENRQAEVSEISRGLKLMAKEFSVPVVVGAQLNRGPEMRADKRPVMADIRESGALENDADVVILLYRDDMYLEGSTRAGEIDLIIPKNRSGPKGTVSLAFQGHYSRVMDMARESWTPSSSLAAS